MTIVIDILVINRPYPSGIAAASSSLYSSELQPCVHKQVRLIADKLQV